MPAKLEDVARRAGVSIATVSRVLADKPHVSAAVRTRVLEAADELAYRPSRVARSLRTQRARIIGLLLIDIRDAFFAPFVRGVEDVAYVHHYSFLLCNTDAAPEKTRVYVDLLRAEHVAGVIALAARATEPIYMRLVDAGIPIVLVNRSAPQMALDTVRLDYAGATEAQVNRLMQAGYRRIGAILMDEAFDTTSTQRAGYERALSGKGVAVAPELIRTGAATTVFGHSAAAALLALDPPPSALYVGAAELMGGVLLALAEQRLRIPDDIVVTGPDTPISSLAWRPAPPSTDEPTYMMGEAAASLLLARITDRTHPPQEVVLRVGVDSSVSFQLAQ